MEIRGERLMTKAIYIGSVISNLHLVRFDNPSQIFPLISFNLQTQFTQKNQTKPLLNPTTM